MTYVRLFALNDKGGGRAVNLVTGRLVYVATSRRLRKEVPIQEAKELRTKYRDWGRM